MAGLSTRTLPSPASSTLPGGLDAWWPRSG